MEQRRFITFLILCLLIWASYFALQAWLGPPPVAKKPKAKNPAELKQPDEKSAEPGDAEKPPVDPTPPAEPSEETKPSEIIAPPPQAPRKKLMLGSLDPATGHALLATFDSRGGVVERVELTNPRYRDIEIPGGYIGHLDLASAASGGWQIETVGAGTPAATAVDKNGGPAGLKPGDVLLAVEGQKIDKPEDLATVLARQVRPDQQIEVQVSRGGEELTFTATACRTPLEVVRPEIRKGQEDPLSLLFTLHTLGKKATRMGESELPGLRSLWANNWEVAEETEYAVAFRFVLTPAMLEAIGQKGSWELIKRYRLPATTEALRNHLTLELELKNTGSEAQEIGYRLDGPTGLPLEGWWYTVKLHPDMWASAGARDVAWKQAGGIHHLIGCLKIVSDAQAAAKEGKPLESGLLRGGEAAALDYIGGDTSYFSAVLLPQKGHGDEPRFIKAVAQPVHDLATIEKARLKTANTSCRLDAEVTSVPAGESVAHEYHVFFGPKEPKLLQQYKIEELLEYGWPIFAYPAKWLRGLLFVLHYLVFNNYGIAIILLTMIVRSCMVPFSLKQAKSAAMMQELAPEMQRIRDKYKEDMEGQSKALRELYAKHNFNPFGGCLLVFFQLPIFVGLYRCLSVDIELRDAPLIPGWQWASNLAGPDKLFYWKDMLWSALGDETGWLGPFFNVFPIITMVLFIIQQKMFTPPATDEQSKMQQQMMMVMTVWMGFLFYKVPAGLCIYFITSSLWGICERKLLPKPKLAGGSGGDKSLVEKAPPRKPSDNGGGKRPTKKTKR